MFPEGKNATTNLRRTCTLLAFGVKDGGYMRGVGIQAAWIMHEATRERMKECNEDAETETLTEILNN